LDAKVKEKTMAKRKFLLVILAMVLVFGFLMTACDDDSSGSRGGVNLSRGRWENSSGVAWYTFSGSNWTYYIIGIKTTSGTFSFSGRTVTLYLSYGGHYDTLQVIDNTTLRDDDYDYWYQRN
jgi:hypothetical protein